MPSGDGFRRRPIVAADFHLQSFRSTKASGLIPLRLCSSASAVPRCDVLSLRERRRPCAAHSGRPRTSRDACPAVVPEHTRNEMSWSGYRASNPGPRPWRGRALPAELYPLGANAHRTQLCRRVRGNLLKSDPPEPTRRRCIPAGREGEPAADRLVENKKARILSESGPRRVIEWRVRALCASLARMHPILVTKRPDRSLALGGMPLIHRDDRGLAEGGAHERTLALHGQRTIGDVALA